jgi:hypothetical protein
MQMIFLFCIVTYRLEARISEPALFPRQRTRKTFILQRRMGTLHDNEGIVTLGQGVLYPVLQEPT